MVGGGPRVCLRECGYVCRWRGDWRKECAVVRWLLGHQMVLRHVWVLCRAVGMLMALLHRESCRPGAGAGARGTTCAILLAAGLWVGMHLAGVKNRGKSGT